MEGTVKGDEGTFNDFMRKVREKLAEICEAPWKSETSDFALSSAKTIETQTWLSIQLKQRDASNSFAMRKSGYPIVGDKLYGSTLRFGEYHEDERRRCIALHRGG